MDDNALIVALTILGGIALLVLLVKIIGALPTHRPTSRKNGLCDRICRQLLENEFSIAELVNLLRCDRSAICDALAQLEGEGWVERRPEVWQDPDGDDVQWRKRRKHRLPASAGEDEEDDD